MKIKKDKKSIILEDVANFNLTHTFECGQCFRWEKNSENSYLGIVNGRVLELEQKKENIIIKNISSGDFNNYFREYFDIDRDYTYIKKILSKDEVMKQAIKFGWGIRILNQDIWECLISFIISANNRIPMIKKTIKNISIMFGDKIIYNNKEYYSFPSPNQLQLATIEDFEKCGAGFRSKYLKSTVDAYLKDDLNLDKIKTSSTDYAREKLQELKGVGPKIADCVILFATQNYDTFPIDVWVKRVMEYFYSDNELKLNQIQGIAKEKFGSLAGFAQQYLFYYARELKIGKK